MEGLGDPSPDEQKRIMEKYGLEMMEVMGGMMSNMQRIAQLAASDPAAAKILSKIRAR